MTQHIFSTQVASSIPYDDSLQAPASGKTDVQGVIDVLKSGPSGQATSAVSSSSTTNASFTLMPGMTLTPATTGNWAIVFTGQFNGTADCSIAVYVNSVQQANSVRTAVGPGGSHNFIMSTSEKAAYTTGNIEIWWASTGATVTGRNITIIKVA